jgi:hypothetical protein
MKLNLSKTGILVAFLLSASIAAQGINTLSDIANQTWSRVPMDAPFVPIAALTFLPSLFPKKRDRDNLEPC